MWTYHREARRERVRDLRRLDDLAILALAFLVTLVSTACRCSPLHAVDDLCEAQSLVASKRAVVMSTGAHTYNRFVAIEVYWMTAEWGYPTTAPTKDNPACLVGYVCSTVDHWAADD